MIRFKRSEVLWIVRGIRLAKFVRCCARSVGHYLRRHHPQPDGRVADEPPGAEAGLSARRVPPIGAPVVSAKARREARQSPAACGGRRTRKRIPAENPPRARAHTPPAGPDH